jgi:hypothetical protein
MLGPIAPFLPYWSMERETRPHIDDWKKIVKDVVGSTSTFLYTNKDISIPWDLDISTGAPFLPKPVRD